MTDHEQPAAGVALKAFAEIYDKAFTGLSDGIEVRLDASFDLQDAIGRARGLRCEHKPISLTVGDFHNAKTALRAPTDAGGAVSEDCQTQASVDRVIGRRIAQQMRDKAAKLARSDKPNMAADMIEEAEALERLAALTPAPQADHVGEATTMIEAPQPLQQGGEVTRERLAAIIDPLAAELREELARTATLIGDDRPPQKLVDDATEHGRRKWDVAFAKADTILALFASLAADRDKAVGLLRGMVDEKTRRYHNHVESEETTAARAFLSSQTVEG